MWIESASVFLMVLWVMRPLLADFAVWIPARCRAVDRDLIDDEVGGAENRDAGGLGLRGGLPAR